MVDLVNKPPHYREDPSGIECIEVTQHMGFLGGNCFKYLYRLGSKDEAIQELGKAAWYANRAALRRETVPYAAIKKMRGVVRHRDGVAAHAMQSIMVEDWVTAKNVIDAEISRLEFR